MSGPRQRYRSACGSTVRLHGSPSNWTIDARPLRLTMPRARSIRFAPDPPRLMVWCRGEDTPQEIPLEEVS